MLEVAGVLRTWALALEPDAGQPIQAEQLADHRLEYLTYEGPLTGERGSVTQWDAGAYETLEESDERWLVRLAGGRLAGTAHLERLAAQRWTFVFSAGTAISG